MIKSEQSLQERYAGFLQEPLQLETALAEIRQRSLSKQKELYKKAGELRRHVPAEVQRILALANEAVEGKLVIPGSGGEPIFVGSPPKWQENPTEKQDIEGVYVINRMEHWLYLAKAYLLTGEESYGRQVVDELMDWITNNPWPGLHQPLDPVQVSHDYLNKQPRLAPWRSLEVGMRMFMSWVELPAYLADLTYFTDEKLTAFLEMVHHHQETLATISPYLYPEADHNHYLMEMLGLLEIVCSFPELKDAGQLQSFAVNELERCAHRQLTAEGGQIEGCPHYHNECAYFFCLAMIRGKAAGVSFSKKYQSLLVKCMEYVMYSLRPVGTCVPWGDSDATQEPIRSGVLGAAALSEPDYLSRLKGIYSTGTLIAGVYRQLWLLAEPEQLLTAAQQAATEELPLLSHQRQLDQGLFRTSWQKHAASVFFACHTPIENPHQHIDVNGFDYTALGQALLIDPGRYTYNDIPERYTFKSAHSHNTLVIDRREPFAYRSSWEYGPQKEGVLTDCQEFPDYFYAQAHHENYQPVTHYRHLILLKEEERPLLLIIDEVKGCRPGEELTLNYHLKTTTAAVDEGQVHGQFEDVMMTIAVDQSGQVTTQSAQASEIMDIAFSTTIVRITRKADSGETCLVTAVAAVKTEVPEVQINKIGDKLFQVITADQIMQLHIDQKHQVSIQQKKGR